MAGGAGFQKMDGQDGCLLYGRPGVSEVHNFSGLFLYPGDPGLEHATGVFDPE